jgi:hypothetical protein
VKVIDSIAIDKACADLTDLQNQAFDHCIGDSAINPNKVMEWAEIKASMKAALGLELS